MENPIKMDDLGGFPPIFGITHISHRKGTPENHHLQKFGDRGYFRTVPRRVVVLRLCEFFLGFIFESLVQMKKTDCVCWN